MKKYSLIIIFAMAGAICRYSIALAMNGAVSFGTLLVNLIGSFLLSFIYVGMKESGLLPKELITAIGTGFIGAFTTFSAFAVDVSNLLSREEIVTAFLYLVVSLTGGLLFAYAGVMISSLMFKIKVQEDEDVN